MERHLKERLVGAAVLIAAAVVLIPEMLSGPQRDPEGEAIPVSGAAPLKTYTIDLSQSLATSAIAPGVAIDNRAPPPDSDVGPAPVQSNQAQSGPVQSTPVQSNPIQSTPSKTNPTESSQPTPSRQVIPEPTPAERPTQVESPPASTTSTTGVAGSAMTKAQTAAGMWAVQVGSFSNRIAADTMVEKLRSGGHDAFVMSFKSGATTMYRVRIGPMSNRESAAQLLREMQPEMPGAAVVPNP